MAPRTLRAVTAFMTLTLLAAACTRSGNNSASTSPSPSVTPSPPGGPAIHIQLNGEKRNVSAGATLAEIAANAGIKLRAGDYVDVAGVVIKPNQYPAKLQVNGAKATKTTVVRPGDSVMLQTGNNHTEPTTSSKQQVNTEMPANPEYKLGVSPGEWIVTRGKESGKIATVTWHPTGKAKVSKEVALTFDDGPFPPYTQKIIKTLHHYNVPATFFLIGYEAQAHPGLVRQEAKMGFAIGDHSWSHPLGFAGLDQSEMVNQISRTYDELKSLGVTPYLFRPPGGSFDGAVVEEARRLGMRTEIWTIDTHDYLLVGKPDTIVKEVLQQVHPGSIVLMHDGGGDRSATVKALPQIIKGLRKKGYTFTTIPKEGWLPGPIPQIQSSESLPPNGKPSKNEPNPAPSLAR